MPIPFETELVSASFNDTYRNLIEQYKEQKAVNDTQELHLTALDGEIVRVDERIDDTNATLENEIARVDGRIDTEVETINGKIDEEKTLREAGDTALGTRIDEEQARADEVFQTKNIPPVTVASVDYTTVESAIFALANSHSSGSVTHDELNGAIASVNTRIDTEIATIDGKIDTEIATLDGKIDTEIATIDANKQSKTLENPVPIPLGTQTDVEETLHALNLQEQIDTSNLSQSIAPEFIETASYNVGDYVMSQGVLYKCRVAHTGAWSDADFELVKIVNEMGGGGTPSPVLYDYVITNQAEFDDWVSNHNDGTETVAIKQGNYTFNGTLRTKNANGNDYNYAILQPKQMDGYGDVVISVSAEVQQLTGIIGEQNENKTNNIKVNVESSGIDYGIGSGSGFYSCSNLTNCSGSGSGSGYGSGFYSCSNLTNCSGSGSGDGIGYGFYSCSNLTNCSGSGSGIGDGIGIGSGFFSCSNLTNCSGSGSSSGDGYGYGFYSCNNLTNCSGSGSSNDVGYGFYECKAVSFCKASNHCTTSVFDNTNCSFSPTYQAQYKCANTLEGGWNNTTNPTA